MKIRLPITPSILCRIKEHWTPYNSEKDIVMLWAAATVFFRFFQNLFGYNNLL